MNLEPIEDYHPGGPGEADSKMNFSTYLLESGPEDVHSPIFTDADNPERNLSWQEYASTVKRIAVGLQDVGLDKGDCVTIVSRNDIYYYILGNGVTAAGGVFAPVSAFAKPVEMDHQLRVTYAQWVFAEPEFLDEVIAAAERVGIPKSRVLIFDAQVPTDHKDHETFSQLLQADEAKYRDLKVDDNQACDRYLTSGSTGLPKAAEMSHKAMIARVVPYKKTYGARQTPKKLSDVRNLHFIDMHHISGWFNNTFTAIGKQTYYVLRRTDALSIIDTITCFKITQIMMHPRMVEEVAVLMQKGVRDRSALASLDMVRVAGSIVRGDFMDILMSYLDSSAHCMISYGATEISTMAATTPGIPRYSGYVGKPPNGMKLMIIDPETLKELPPDTDGEICAQGIGMFTGYVNNPSATQKALLQTSTTGTWLRTGDKGHWSSSLQQLAITGRYKETFKVGTEEVAPEEVEVELLKRPGISDVAITSTDARPGQGGLEPLAYVVASDKGVSAQEVVDYVARRVAAYKAPTGGVMFCERIPRTSFGKLQRARLNGMGEEEICCEERSRRFLTPSIEASHL